MARSMADSRVRTRSSAVDRTGPPGTMPEPPDRESGGGGVGLTERATIEPPTRGQAAERLVVERLRAVVDPKVLVLDNVQWLLRERGAVRNGEADVVIGDPDRGILVIEVKAGEIR